MALGFFSDEAYLAGGKFSGHNDRITVISYKLRQIAIFQRWCIIFIETYNKCANPVKYAFMVKYAKIYEIKFCQWFLIGMIRKDY